MGEQKKVESAKTSLVNKTPHVTVELAESKPQDVGVDIQTDKANSATWVEYALMVCNLLIFLVDVLCNSAVFIAGGYGSFDGTETMAALNAVPSIAAPPGVTFSIWGIIFGWQLVFMIAQFCLPLEKVMQITPGIIVSQALQACYGLVIYLITDQMTLLIAASA